MATYWLKHYGFVGDEPYLAHHGIQGQRWGIRNGPPYPLSKSSSDKTMHNASDAKQKTVTKNLINRLNNTWDYGCMIDGKKYIDTAKVDWSKYKTMPIKDLKKYKIGTCWDFVNYQHYIFKKNGIDDSSYFFLANRKDDKDHPITHTFSMVNIGEKQYWAESAFWKNRGVHEVGSYKDVVDRLLNSYSNIHKYELYKYNPDGMDNNLTGDEFFNRIVKNTNRIL